MIRRALVPFLFSLTLGSLLGDTVRFSQDIRPILSSKCFQCHGPDQQNRKAKLRLDRSDTDQGAYRVRRGVPAIKPGDLAASAVWERINATDPDDVMPPPEAKLEAITSDEKALIRDWISAGAAYEEFWAFAPPRASPLPDSTDQSATPNPIDRFVQARLTEEGLAPNPPASKRTLIRRLTFDLTGLPPTRAEIESFLDNPSDRAYEELVERLLAKPQFGEHMAKYWLDLVRFADTNGLHHDHYREMTPYRDWVIRSFNENLPFNDFISYQIAGDLYPNPTIEQQIASGFNRLHLIIDRGTALPEESFTRNVVDRVTSVGTAFLGLTVQCAVCHDHKYDPITQRDFYQLFAFFNNFDGGPETGGRNGNDFKRGLQEPYIELPTPSQSQRRKELNRAIALLETEVKALKTKENESDPETADRINSLTEKVKRQQKAREALELTIPATLVMKERDEIRPAHILTRGAYDQPGEEVQRNTPGFLPPLEPSGEIPTRFDLARWLVSDRNPLTARVTVNRTWQQFFGVGIVKTSEDFGVQGELPSHPELLDFLALEFTRTNWDLKNLIRLIVQSRTYQQSSHASPEAYRNDAENRLLARGPRFRLDSEMIRDQILAISGQLSSKLYGKSVKPPQPPDLWKTVAMPNSYPRVFQPDDGEEIYRRSIYTFWKRALPPPQMTIFDAPTREACIARRERTNTPLQALLLMNEREYFRATTQAAKRLLSTPVETDRQRIELAYETVTSQLPEPAELETLTQALGSFRELYRAEPDLATAFGTQASTSSQGPPDRAELASWTLIVHSLLNLDITKTRQ